MDFSKQFRTENLYKYLAIEREWAFHIMEQVWTDTKRYLANTEYKAICIYSSAVVRLEIPSETLNWHTLVRCGYVTDNEACGECCTSLGAVS
jgi:hypothetical protein